jgi:CRISPR-associated protein Csm3
MKLNAIHTLRGALELVTGLHIGGGSDEMHIGGTDNPVVKHPYTQEPFIPGSSLKGRMRSLLEWRAGIVGPCEGQPLSVKALSKLSGEQERLARRIAQLFGVAGQADDALAIELGPTRLSFWDCSLQRSWVKDRNEANQLYTESKSENMIYRIRGGAEHPRQTERVPAGAVFEFRLSVRELEGDQDLLDDVLAGMKLMELDGIGGSGSRGYGKIRFSSLELNGDSVQTRYDALQPFGQVA